VTRYIDLPEYLWLAEQVTGVNAAVMAKASRTDLADSALNPDPPAVDDAEQAVLAIAAGEVDEAWVAAGCVNASSSDSFFGRPAEEVSNIRLTKNISVVKMVLSSS